MLPILKVCRAKSANYWNRRAVALALGLTLIAATAFVVLAQRSSEPGGGDSGLTIVAPPPMDRLPGAHPDDRIVIPKAGVDARFQTSRFSFETGEMASPEGPDDVLFYDFREVPGLGGYPGVGGNSIFSGHLDYGTGACRHGTVPPPCTAVFWDLDRLIDGDIIELWVGGERFRYEVAGRVYVNAVDDTAWTWQANLVSTELESITLITCAGEFDSVTRDYSRRLFVRAIRI